MRDLDIGLLRTFVTIIDSGGFARASERVHRSQSTISQQLKKLEDVLGRALLLRNARRMALTPDGERLLLHARRMLALHDETLAAFRPQPFELLRIGVTEDWAVQELPHWLEALCEAHPALHLEVVCDLSVCLEAALAQGELDIALFKKLGVAGGVVGTWRQPLHWVGNAALAQAAMPQVPLVAFSHGCVYRRHALDVLDSLGRPWRLAYSSPNLTGVVAALQAGLGVSVLPLGKLPGDVRPVGPQAGLPPLPTSQMVLDARPDLSAAGRDALRMLAGRLEAEFG